MSFKENDRVRVSADMATKGMTGVVEKIFESGALLIKLENGQSKGYFESELDLVDGRREALIELAETLDSARQQANNINGTEGTVYQSITTPLISVLDALVPVDATGYDAYEFIIEDGLSVRDALKAVEK